MRKFIASLAIVTLAVTLVTASITLTTGKLVAINGVTQENDSIGGCSGYAVDYIGNTVTFTFVTGTIVSGNINKGIFGDTVLLTLNLTSGAWTSTNGGSGTISGATLTNFVNQLKSNRNLVETFVAGNTVMPGTQVAWP
jgi:hypothetical protein